jgi:hypothetical protein
MEWHGLEDVTEGLFLEVVVVVVVVVVEKE